MRWLAIIFFVGASQGQLWPKGIVHFAINPKDYDVHSQDIILSAFTQIQNEICVKFFTTPMNPNRTNQRILYLNNPDKRKTCPPITYDYSKKIVDMPIGYKCLNAKEIARMVVDMLRASIDTSVSPVNSYDLVRKFQDKEAKIAAPSLLSHIDRNYINAHYSEECAAIVQKLPNLLPIQRRQTGDLTNSLQLTEDNIEYYNNKVWPLAIVMYGIDDNLRKSANFELLQFAMMSIQQETCVVFQEVFDTTVLRPRNLVWFGESGDEVPSLGIVEGVQNINLTAMVRGASGHTSHTLNNLMRILGIGMMSNRYDRDNYVEINWSNVQTGYERYFEKLPEDAWLVQIPYDYDSVTHAPANYMCRGCELGAATVRPTQDHLWQRIMTMGHQRKLSESDVKLLNILYSKQCKSRYLTDDK